VKVFSSAANPNNAAKKIIWRMKILRAVAGFSCGMGSVTREIVLLTGIFRCNRDAITPNPTWSSLLATIDLATIVPASDLHAGHCLCGSVEYEIRGPLAPVTACHCSQCRRTSGHHVAMTSVPEAAFRLKRADTLRWYRSSGLAIAKHIYVDDEGDYYAIDDTAAQFPGNG
jgi:hypothetical protein